MDIFKLLKMLGMDEWLWQETGVIDHSQRANFPGTQPVRVLTHVTIHFLQNTHTDFFDEIVQLVKEGKLDKHLDLQYGEVPIAISETRYRTPKIVNETRTVQLHETFLSYQWCVAYAIYTLYVETIDYPRINEKAGEVVKKVTPEKIEQAKELFAYAKYLIKYFAPWDKENSPNPEKYSAEERIYIEQTNLFYTESMKFILCHELAHAKKHLDNLPDQDCANCFQDMEFEADNEAIDNMLKGANYDNNFLIEIGITLGLLSMIFFRSTTTGVKHPNVEDRLTNALYRMAASDDSIAWAFACIGLELWDEQFELFLNWKQKGKITYKELYFDIVKQIKEK